VKTQSATPGKEVRGKEEFATLKKTSSASNLGGSSRIVAETQNYITQNENNYFGSKKLFYKPDASYSKYHYSTPSFLRMLEKPSKIMQV